MYAPSVDAIGSSLTLTALCGLLPLAAFFIMLGVFKIKTHWCALGALAISSAIAIFGSKMPILLTFSAAAQGAAFGMVPIILIVIMAVWLYNLTEISGREKDVRTLFSMVGRGDMRVQALLIGFCFCGLLEGLAGFGAPVAIACAMLIALGLKPIKAGVLTMVGNALNVGFGAMAIPVTTAAKLGGSEPANVGATMGRITPFLIIFTPLLLLAIIDGIRGVKQTAPAAIVAGIGMGVGHFIAANFLSYELTAVFASLLSFAALTVFMQFWQPHTPEELHSTTGSGKLPVSRAILGLLPYILVVVILAVAKLWKLGINLPEALKTTDIVFKWPGVYGVLVDSSGKPAKSGIFTLTWLSSPGAMLLFTGIIVVFVYAHFGKDGEFRMGIAQGFKALAKTVMNLRMAILTICAVMALAYVMNYSGQTVAIGTWLAGTGTAFALLSAVLGWIGTAVTGSATSAGALFAKLQAAAAQQAHLDPNLLIGVNEIGGGIGKIVSPQNLAIAATAIKKPGSEAELLRTAFPISAALLICLGIITLLASLGPLAFVIVGG